MIDKSLCLESFKKNIFDKSNVIDPDDECEWETLAYGFFLGKGFSPNDARLMVEELTLRGWL